MNSATRRSPLERDRAVSRLRAITIGSGLAGVAAVGGFGALAGASYDGSTSTDAVTAAAVTTTTTSAPTSTSTATDSTSTTETSLSATSTPTTTTSASTHATTGGS